MSSVSPADPPLRRRKFRGLSLEERRSQRREALLDAGLEAFGTRGFHATGVRDICTQARLTERYFYESFPNREALFLEVYGRAALQVRDDVDRALGASSEEPREQSRAGLRASLGAFKADPRLARILLLEVFGVGGALTAAPLLVSQAFTDQISERMPALAPDFLRMGLDLGTVASGLYGATVNITIQWALGGFREPLEVVVEHCALFYDGLLAELERTRSK
jgi:AcrR family transcriptional regulator